MISVLRHCVEIGILLSPEYEFMWSADSDRNAGRWIFNVTKSKRIDQGPPPSLEVFVCSGESQ